MADKFIEYKLHGKMIQLPDDWACDVQPLNPNPAFNKKMAQHEEDVKEDVLHYIMGEPDNHRAFRQHGRLALRQIEQLGSR